MDNETLFKSPAYTENYEKIRAIICDKYGIEGDSEIDNMINDIIEAIFLKELTLEEKRDEIIEHCNSHQCSDCKLCGDTWYCHGDSNYIDNNYRILFNS